MSVLTFRDIHCHSIRLSPTNWTKGKKKKKKSWNQGRTPSASQLPRVKFLTFNFQLSWLKVFTISSKETSPVDMLYCAQSRPTLWDPIDYSPLGSSVHGISQAEILEWVAISSSSQPNFKQWGIDSGSLNLGGERHCGPVSWFIVVKSQVRGLGFYPIYKVLC